jgi:hypothetical protein
MRCEGDFIVRANGFARAIASRGQMALRGRLHREGPSDEGLTT